MYLVTVIIPVYNAEKYLKRAINSLINQTIDFKNIELILVDDNSSDSSKDIIKEYSSNYDNIKPFFSDKNHGFPGYGRNVGIKNATADYIMFMDNDDEYEPEFCEIAYGAIKNEQCEVVLVNYTTFENSLVLKRDNFSNINHNIESEYNSFKFIKLNELINISVTNIWAMIFKKSIILNNNITFVEDRFNEDSLFLYEYYYYANYLLLINYYGYKHYRHGNNLSHYSPKVALGYLNSYYEILDLIKSQYDNIDMGYMFKDKVESTFIRIMFSSNQKCLLKKLYDFEMKINFNSSSLDKFWTTFCNNLLLKRKFSILIIVLKLLKFVKKMLDLLRRLYFPVY